MEAILGKRGKVVYLRYFSTAQCVLSFEVTFDILIDSFYILKSISEPRRRKERRDFNYVASSLIAHPTPYQDEIDFSPSSFLQLIKFRPFENPSREPPNAISRLIAAFFSRIFHPFHHFIVKIIFLIITSVYKRVDTRK